MMFSVRGFMITVVLAAAPNAAFQVSHNRHTLSRRSTIEFVQLRASQLPDTSFTLADTVGSGALDQVTAALQSLQRPTLPNIDLGNLQTPQAGGWDQVSDVLKSFTPPKLPSIDVGNLKSIEEQVNSLKEQLSSIDVGAFETQLETLKAQVDSFDAQILEKLASISTELNDGLLEDAPYIRPLYTTVTDMLQPLAQSPTLALLASSFLTYFVVSSLLSMGQSPPPSQPYPMNRYDPIAARAYFDRRLPKVIGRGLEIFVQSAQFGLKLLKDWIDGSITQNEFQRGRELATLLTKLGPTFIKVGQSLSIRTDLLSPAYVRGLETLQDQVPAFSTSVSKRLMEEQWGKPVEDILIDELSAEPVAAASLGQVFRARLKSTGEEVAVKVQRPDITEQIALDMHLLREAAPIAKRLFDLNTDTVGTVDAWGLGFVDELDYLQEARNAQFFSERIQETPLKDVVFAPRVIEDYSTRSVLVSEWVDGERLDRSAAEDVTVLCSIAMNTYLTMLLDLGLLHCDPHPGNLLRAKADGRLCILDWGMVTRLSPDLQLTLIEHMAHLTSADYAEIPRDLLLLDFIPKDKEDLIEDSGVVELLAEIYGAWTGGGGAAAINVNKVIGQLQDLTAEKGNLFQIPPYFAYIAKSFSVLEGIGLSFDPKYSIINECLPYVSRRLLTDKENMGPALSTFIFGPAKTRSDRIVDYDRVEQLVEGFGNYATSASGALLGKEDLSRTELLEQAADQILDLVFDEEETPLQKILVEQTAKIATAGGRYFWTELRERSGTLPSGRTIVGTLIDPLGLWRTSPLVRMNDLDRETVDTTQKLFSLIQRQLEHSGNPVFDLETLSREEAVTLTRILTMKLWERRRGVLQTGNRFVRQLLQLTAEKLENGERDTRTLPSRPQLEESPPKDDASPQQTISSQTTHETVAESKRLQAARERLEGLEEENPSVAVPDPLLAKTRL